jgi:RNA polymerase sigma-70 factor, ECF subfamily
MSSPAGDAIPDDSTVKSITLLAHVAGGDARAFSELYDMYCTTMRAIAIGILSDAAEADDVLQEVFIRIWERAGQYDSAQGSPASWLFSSMRNACLNRVRSRKRGHAVLERAARETVLTPESAGSAYDWLVTTERAGSVRRALLELPDEQRVPMELAYLKGLTYDEVARVLCQPLGSVKSRLRRGMARLKISLSQFDPTLT